MKSVSLVTIILIAVCVAAPADETGPAVPNLDGFQYICFARFGDEGPDPEGELDVPLFAHFVQENGRVYGALVLPAILDEDALAAQNSFFGFEVSCAYDGVYKGKKLTLKIDDDGQEVEYKIKVLKNGEKLKLTIPIAPSGNYTVQMQRVNADKNYLSGMYIGTSGLAFSPPGHVDNTLIGVQIDGEKMSASLGYFDDVFNTLVLGRTSGTYDPNTGQFNLPAGKDAPEVTGTIVSGAIQFTATFDTDLAPASRFEVSGTAYYFSNSPAKKLKATRIRPKNVNDGTTPEARAYHKAALAGCVVRIVPVGGSTPPGAALGLVSFQYGAKYLTLSLDTPAGVSGKYKVEITNPDGKQATSKKTLTVK